MKNILKKVLSLVLIFVLITGFSVSSSAFSLKDLTKKKTQNENKEQELKDKQEEVQEIKDQTLKEVESLNSKITEYQGQISSLNGQIDDANTQLNEAQKQLEQKESEYSKKQDTFKQRLAVIYEAGDTSYLDVLLSSKGLTDFISNYYLVSELSQMDSQLIDNLEKEKQEIEESKKGIEAKKQELATAKASKESASKELKTAKSAKDAKVTQLSAEEQQIQKEIDEIAKDNVQINKDIKAMEAQIKAAQEAAKKNESGKNNNNSGSNSGTSSAGFIRPVNSSITTGMYYSSGAYHGAVDFGASGVNGMPVYAVADGLVVTTKALTTSYGNYIIIYHPSSNLFTLYAHGQAGSIAVSQGQTVKQGQQIMRVGSTGNSSGPHLHFEVRVYPGEYSNRVNPMNYLP